MSGKRVIVSDSPEQPPAWRADLDRSAPLPTEPLTGWRASLTRAETVGLAVAALSIVTALVGLAVTNGPDRAGSVVPVVMPPATADAAPTPSGQASMASDVPSVPVVVPTSDATTEDGVARSARPAAAAPRTAAGTSKASARPSPARSSVVASVQPSPSPTATRTEVFYRNCVQVRAEHPGPLLAGQPGYRDALDKDGDGIACNEGRGPGR